MQHHIGKSLNRQIALTAIFTKVITMIQMPKSGTSSGTLHSYQSDFKELEVFGSDILALSNERLPFHAIFIHKN